VHEVIPAALAGERVDRALAMLADVSRSVAAIAIADGRVFLDDAPVTTRSARVSAEQVMRFTQPDEIDVRLVPDPLVEVGYLHVDEHVLVIDKAAGQVVHPGAGNLTGTIAQGVLARFPEVVGVGEPERPGVVHRLDKGTSGVFVMARTALAHVSLTEQLKKRTVDRKYLALVWGRPEARSGVVDAPIGRAIRDPTRMTIRDDGKAARTNYSVEADWLDPRVALLSCVLDSGRTHQIRVHLQAIGHPVVGDTTYGERRDDFDIRRPALHAAELAFSHPDSGERIAFESKVPPDIAAAIERLGPPEHGQ